MGNIFFEFLRNMSFLIFLLLSSIYCESAMDYSCIGKERQVRNAGVSTQIWHDYPLIII